jgi:hypothetical protein
MPRQARENYVKVTQRKRPKWRAFAAQLRANFIAAIKDLGAESTKSIEV